VLAFRHPNGRRFGSAQSSLPSSQSETEPVVRATFTASAAVFESSAAVKSALPFELRARLRPRPLLSNTFRP
jgi:hypothetical protein